MQYVNLCVIGGMPSWKSFRVFRSKSGDEDADRRSILMTYGDEQNSIFKLFSFALYFFFLG